MEEFTWLRTMLKLREASNASLKLDRKAHFNAMAAKTNQLAKSGNPGASFCMVKSLAGCAPKPVKAVKSQSGDILTCPQDVKRRWQEHFAGIFGGSIASLNEVCFPDS